MSETVRRGIQAATKFHSENTGLPYAPLAKLEAGKFVTVRVLQPESEWVSLFMHRDFKTKVPSTRCVDQNDEPNIDACLLCAHDIGRQLRTFIPVRVRGDENQTRVQVVDYGRDNLAEVMSQLEELPEGSNITMLDFKIKRQGTGTDTKYRWIPSGNERKLNEDELALVVPDLEELIQKPTDVRMKALVAKFGASLPDPEEDDEDKPATSSRSPF